MTSPWVMAAMMRSAPCWQNGQRTISTAKTRFSSRAQLQGGDAVLASCSSTPCWWGVGMIAPRDLQVKTSNSAPASAAGAAGGEFVKQNG